MGDKTLDLNEDTDKELKEEFKKFATENNIGISSYNYSIFRKGYKRGIENKIYAAGMDLAL